MRIAKENFIVADDQIYGYSPERILIQDYSRLNKYADIRQKAKGELPFFDDSGEYDDQGWYDFYLDCDADGVKRLYYENGIGGGELGEIPMDDRTKRNAFEAVVEYYGGIEEYRKALEDY